MCGVQLKKTEKRSMDFMFMLSLCEIIDHLAMANSVRWYGHVLRREDKDFEVEGQKKNGRPKKTWKMEVEEESLKVCLTRADALC